MTSLRLVFPALAFLAASLSIFVDRTQPASDAALCLRGACRFEQVMTTMEARGATPAGLVALVQLDQSNPHVWASYGEYLAGVGELDAAARAYDQAAALGPGLAPVLMRAANFDFSHERSAQGLALVPKILLQTSDFDEILFSYVDLSARPVSELMGMAIPASPAPARAWLAWLRGRAPEADVRAVWDWLHSNGLSDDATAADAVNALWQRKAYTAARQIWMDYTNQSGPVGGGTEMLANTEFGSVPSRTPFDWTLAPAPGVTFTHNDGLEVRFLGEANVAAVGVAQQTVVLPGRYRFTAVVSADQVSTDEGVGFQIVDGEDASRLHVETARVRGTVARTELALDVTVPPETQILRVALTRTPSLKFDNKVSGVLRVHRVSLAPVPGSQPRP